MVVATSWKVQIPRTLSFLRFVGMGIDRKFGIPVYLGHLLAQNQTSWVGTILLIFTSLVTIVVAAYLWREFREYKRRNDRVGTELDLEGGETEFEVTAEAQPERAALVRRHSDDDFFFDDEDETGR